MATPTILIAGATGNTGQEVIRILPSLLKGGSTKIIALTRSLDTAVAKELSKLEGVKFEQKDWTDINADWLRERSITKAFIAPQNGATQFADESAFHLALLQAGVKYVVRTATGIQAMTPSSPIWYGRNHWAITTLLDSDDFEALAYTNLCPNTFTTSYLSTAVDWVKDYRKSGKQVPLDLPLDESAKVAMINLNDVGRVAANLLALDDYTSHDGQSYVLAGPDDITGRDIVNLIEAAAGVKVETVNYRNTRFLEDLAKQGVIPQKFVSALVGGIGGLWDGSSSHTHVTTSPAIMRLAPPLSKVDDAFHQLITQG